MEYLQLYAKDADEDMELEETVNEENAEEADFIDDSSSVCFSADPSFYSQVDNIEDVAANVDKEHVENLRLTSEDYKEWLINPKAKL